MCDDRSKSLSLTLHAVVRYDLLVQSVSLFEKNTAGVLILHNF